MAKLADARDLKSRGTNLLYRFDPGFRHQYIAEWSSLVARRAHNPKVAWFKSRLRNQKQKQSNGLLFCFWNDVFRTRNVMRTSCVMLPSAVMCASRVSKEHITSLCAIGAIHHFERSEQHHLPARANITLYKLSKLWYNIIESKVLLWLNQNCVNYQWIFPLIL